MSSLKDINSTKIYSSRKNYSRGYIYQILNTNNGKLYIGSTINFDIRKRTHLRALKDNKHVNKYLQNSWNKYGENSFIIEAIECVTDIDVLIEREQFYMDLYKSYVSKFGYNINKYAASSLGTKLSLETKEKIRQSHLRANRRGENSYQWGRKWSQEVKDKISKVHKGKIVTPEMRKNMSVGHIGIAQGVKNPRAKLTDNHVKEIKLLWKFGEMFTSDIARYYSVTKSAVDGIVHMDKWSHIAIDNIDSLPIELNQVIEHNEISRLLKNKEGKSRAILTYTMLKDLVTLIEYSELTVNELANIFYISKRTVNSIKNGKTFKEEIDAFLSEVNGSENCTAIIKKYKLYNTLINSNKSEYYYQ